MSRWSVEFQGHPFWLVWVELKDRVNSLMVDDQTVLTAVEELSRLKRVVDYISGIIDGVEPDLTPKSVWDNFYPQAQQCLSEVNNYMMSKNLGHLVNANSNADNLLSYVRPYMVLPDQAIVASRDATVNLVGALESRMQAFQGRMDQGMREISETTSLLNSEKVKIDQVVAGVHELGLQLFGVPGANDGTKAQIETLKSQVEQQAGSISDLFLRLVKQRESDGSVEDGFQQADARVRGLVAQVVEMRDSFGKKLQEIDRYYTSVFGAVAPDGVAVAGLKAEIEARMDSINSLISEQDIKFKALFLKIEALLPGATSAGLASAYKEMRASFVDRIGVYTRMFYLSLSGLFVAGLFAVIQNFELWPIKVSMVEVPDWQGMLRLVLYKIPLFIPVVWLAIFSATRRSQYERLQQEYAHKEALAKSYESYKLQLEALGQMAEGLRSKLMEKTIDAVAFNASETLDKNHREKSPVESILEKVTLDDLKKLVDLVKEKK